MSEVPT
ncbi:hypothetical protein AVEN_81213-1, partial [Araneus ventricosus]